MDFAPISYSLPYCFVDFDVARGYNLLGSDDSAVFEETMHENQAPLPRIERQAAPPFHCSIAVVLRCPGKEVKFGV